MRLNGTISRVPKRLLFRLVILSMMACQTSVKAQDSHTRVLHHKVLSTSSKRVVFDKSAFYGPSTLLPLWSNGYLVSLEAETFQPGSPNVRLYDETGKKVREAAIWFEGSQRVIIYSAVATPDGRILASGVANKVDGTTGSFIALTDLAGRTTDVIQTNGFFPAHICQGPDGNIWSFGGTGYDDQSQPKPGDTLRRFDIEKGQISSYLPRATFPKYPVPEEMAYIHCSIDGVVVYSSKARKYIEMKYQGDQPHIYQVAQVPTGLRLSGFAQTGSKKIYGHFYRSGNNGLYYLSFDEGAKTVNWVPVEGTVGIYSKPGVIRGLWGADADKLLVNRAEDAASEVAVHWVTPVDQ